MQTVKTINDLEIIIKSTDLNNRNSLWYIQNIELYAVLDTIIMDMLISKQWMSEYEIRGTIFDTSQVFKILKLNETLNEGKVIIFI